MNRSGPPQSAAGSLAASRVSLPPKLSSDFEPLHTLTLNRRAAQGNSFLDHASKMAGSFCNHDLILRHPSYQDRVGQAAIAKERALEQLRLRPKLDEKTAAERKAASTGAKRVKLTSRSRRRQRSKLEHSQRPKPKPTRLRLSLPKPSEKRRVTPVMRQERLAGRAKASALCLNFTTRNGHLVRPIADISDALRVV